MVFWIGRRHRDSGVAGDAIMESAVSAALAFSGLFLAITFVLPAVINFMSKKR